jgi:hypothetical protein
MLSSAIAWYRYYLGMPISDGGDGDCDGEEE